MTLTYTMDDEQWNMLIQDVADSFDEVTISRGFQYYKQGRVQELTMPAPQYVEAIVHGNEEYDVEMDLNFFSASQCNCPVEGTCKHMMAAILEYAFEQARPVNMLVNAKSITTFKLTNQRSAHVLNFRTAGQGQVDRKKAERASRIKEQAAHIPSMSVLEWHELFELCIEQLPQDIRSFLYVEQALNIILELKPKLQSDIEHIYMLNVHLFLLYKLINKRLHHSDYYYNHSGDSAIADVMESIEAYYSNGNFLSVKPDHQDHLQLTLAYIREKMLRESSDTHYFLDVYYSFWHYWVCPYVEDTRPYSDELLKLEQAAGAAGLALSTFHYLMAQARMNFFMIEDEEAWRLLMDAKTHKAVPSNMSLYYLYYLTHQQQWNRLLNWLTALPPLYRSYRRDYLSKYMEFWELVINQLPEAENSMWDTLINMLPYSSTIYEEKLLQHSKWKQWMDYHLSTGTDPSEFRVSELQPMDKFAPEVLLPFYHQAVERYVMIKNRDGYKAAVKLLKRLAKLYRRLKRVDRWEQFLAAFVGRYSRLRALQEELKKGKLLQ